MEVTVEPRFLSRARPGGNPLLQKLLHLTPTPFRGASASCQPTGIYLFCCPSSLSLFSSCFPPHNTRSSHQLKSLALRERPVLDPLTFGSVLCVYATYPLTHWPWSWVCPLGRAQWGRLEAPAARVDGNKRSSRATNNPLSESLIVLHCW